MRKKQSRILFIFVLVAALGFAVYIYTNFFSVETFTTEGANLYGKSKHYIRGKDELNLTALKLGPQIGKTNDGESIFEIEGQETHDYVYVVGEMWESVYRNSNIPVLTMNNLEITKIELDRGKKVSQDKALINELIQTFKFAKEGVNGNVLENNIASVHEIILFSPKLKGIGYKIIVNVTKDSRIYLSEAAGYKTIPASKLLTAWIKK
jgi:hypothetical protein